VVGPDSWSDIPFEQAFARVNTGGKKLHKSEYAEAGCLPVIDQGQSKVAGFTNRSDLELTPPQDGYVVFGDHTRAVKYCDFPFVAGADGVQILRSHEKHNAKYLYFALSSADIPNTGYNRHFKFLKELVFACPPSVTEEASIADALSDADAAIESLEALIAKKRDIKQATMQQLLTGQARLPGFNSPWRNVKLSSIAELSPGINKPLASMGSGYLYVTVQDIYKGASLSIEGLGRIEITKSEYERFSLKVGDLVMGKSSVKRDGIGYPNLFTGAAEGVVPSGFTYRIRTNSELVDSQFLLQYLRSDPARKWIINNSQASALTNINATIVGSFPIVLPCIDEQEAIAAVLKSMDADLDACINQAANLRLVKQGMMQDLLTGKVRLV